MSKIINYADREPRGTFSQILLDDGKRILVSLSQTEIAIFKLILGGAIPTKKVFEYDISEFIDFFSIRVEQIGIEGSVLEAVVNYILPCRNINEVADKLNKVVEGANSPEVKKEIQEKLEKQVSGLFENQ